MRHKDSATDLLMDSAVLHKNVHSPEHIFINHTARQYPLSSNRIYVCKRSETGSEVGHV